MSDPIHVAFIQTLNHRFSIRRLEEDEPLDLEERTLPEILGRLEIDVPDSLLDYIDAMPSSIASAVSAVIATALRTATPTVFAWLASSDFELTVGQADRAAGSLTTVILRAPSPGDLAGRAADAQAE